MHGRGGGARLPGTRIATAIVALAFACASAEAGGRNRPDREYPPYGIQSFGADGREDVEDDPHVGRAQGLRIVREGLRASLKASIRRPLWSLAINSRRLEERLSVRAIELLPTNPALARLLRGPDLGEPPDADLGEAGGPPTPARLTFLPGSEPALRSLLGLIAGSRRRIDLMMYGWQDDPTGREVARALAARARAGVRVRLMVDRTGFLIHNPAAAADDRTFLDDLRATPNVSVIEPPGTFFRFDHRKLVIVDDRVAWSGSMILTDSSRRLWRNFNYLAEGPIVAQFVALFAVRWREQGGCPAGPLQPPPPVEANATVRLVRTDVEARTLKRAVYHAVDHARRSITIENPYFSDEILTRKLIAARARGVDVRAILTVKGNLGTMNRFEAITANRLLRGGVRVYLYPGMTHVKALSADGVWSYIGTGNFDELSLRNNREVSLAIASPALAGELDRSLFGPDLAASRELTGPLPAPRNRLRLIVFSLWY